MIYMPLIIKVSVSFEQVFATPSACNTACKAIVPFLFHCNALYIKLAQSTKRARSGRKRERALRPGLRIHLGRGGQSANSVKLYKISSWEPGKKHHSTCRAS